MERYGWLVLAGLGWAVLVGTSTAVYARWNFARRGWTEPLRTRAFDRMQQTQSSFEAISQAPVRTPDAPAQPVRETEPRLVPVASAPVLRPMQRPEMPTPVPQARPAAEARPAAVESVDGERPAARRPSTLSLLQRLSDPDPLRRTAALWLATSLPDADRLMVRALSDEFPMVRREAVRVLGRIGTEEATKALTEVAAHDTSSEVREEAVAALAEVIRRRNETAIEDSTG